MMMSDKDLMIFGVEGSGKILCLADLSGDDRIVGIVSTREDDAILLAATLNRIEGKRMDDSDAPFRVIEIIDNIGNFKVISG